MMAEKLHVLPRPLPAAERKITAKKPDGDFIRETDSEPEGIWEVSVAGTRPSSGSWSGPPGDGAASVFRSIMPDVELGGDQGRVIHAQPQAAPLLCPSRLLSAPLGAETGSQHLPP